MSAAYDTTALEAPGSRFRPFERLPLASAGAALGAMAGLAATLAMGVLEPWAAAACVAPVYFMAFWLADKDVGESLRERIWGAGALAALGGLSLSAGGRPRRAYRAAAMAFMVAGLAANQSFVAALGA